jgi:integrase
MKLRLVGGGTSRDGEAGGGQEVEITLKIRVSLSQIALIKGVTHGPIGDMPTAVSVPVVQDAPVVSTLHATAGVAGSIIPDQGLPKLIEGYVQHLRDKKKSPDTVTRWRHTLLAQAREAGWSEPSHIAGAVVEDWILTRASEKGWSGATVRSYAAAWRGFTRWAARRGHLPTDPMLAMETAKIEDAGPGARAATTEEARLLLAHTAVLERMDKRACPRLAYFAMLFLAGCRASEPGRLLWSDLRLDDPTPHVVWRPETQKNRRRAVLALAPELVAVLRGVALSVKRNLGEIDNAPVFPSVPNRRTFVNDATQAGIVIADRDGATLSFHSARKWFSTTLTNAGVPTRMVDFLMRHNGSVESRYFRPTLQDQVAALQNLPPLGLMPQGFSSRGAKIEQDDRRQSATAADTQGAASENVPVSSHQEISKLGRPQGTLMQHTDAFARDSDDRTDGRASSFSGEQVSPLASKPLNVRASQHGNRGYTLGSADQTIRALIDANRAMLDAMESLLREEHADGSHP